MDYTSKLFLYFILCCNIGTKKATGIQNNRLAITITIPKKTGVNCSETEPNAPKNKKTKAIMEVPPMLKKNSIEPS